MSYTLIFSKSYEKRSKKFFNHHPELLSVYEKTLILMTKNPFHPSLRLYKLKGSLKSLYSISINMQYRVVIDFLIEDDKILFIDNGAHDQIYS